MVKKQASGWGFEPRFSTAGVSERNVWDECRVQVGSISEYKEPGVRQQTGSGWNYGNWGAEGRSDVRAPDFL